MSQWLRCNACDEHALPRACFHFCDTVCGLWWRAVLQQNINCEYEQHLACKLALPEGRWCSDGPGMCRMKESELLEKIQAARDEVHPTSLHHRGCFCAFALCITPVVIVELKKKPRMQQAVLVSATQG